MDTVVVSETSNSPAKILSTLRSVPIAAERVTARLEDEDQDMTAAEKVCAKTSSKEDVWRI